MIKLLRVLFLLLFSINTPVNSVSASVANQTLKEYINYLVIKGVNTNIPCNSEFDKQDLREVVSASPISPRDVNFCKLLYLRAITSNSLQRLGSTSYETVLSNAFVEFQAVNNLVRNNMLPEGYYIHNVPADLLRGKLHTATVTLRKIQDAANASLDVSPTRNTQLIASSNFGSPNSFLKAHSPSGFKNLPFEVFEERRIRYALMSEAQRRAMEAEEDRQEQRALAIAAEIARQEQYERALEAERQRNALCYAMGGNLAALNSVDVESQEVLGSVEECLLYQSQITQLIKSIEHNTALMQGNSSYLRESSAKLKILKSRLKDTLESLQIISGGLPGGNF